MTYPPDYITQTIEHTAAFLDEAVPAVREAMAAAGQDAEDPEGFLKTAYTLSGAIRDREDLADIAALAIRYLAADADLP